MKLQETLYRREGHKEYRLGYNLIDWNSKHCSNCEHYDNCNTFGKAGDRADKCGTYTKRGE